jgi:hypothetical protein
MRIACNVGIKSMQIYDTHCNTLVHCVGLQGWLLLASDSIHHGHKVARGFRALEEGSGAQVPPKFVSCSCRNSCLLMMGNWGPAIIKKYQKRWKMFTAPCCVVECPKQKLHNSWLVRHTSTRIRIALWRSEHPLCTRVHALPILIVSWNVYYPLMCFYIGYITFKRHSLHLLPSLLT